MAFATADHWGAVTIANQGCGGAITIANQGCGTSPVIQARIFDRFFSTGGVGDGLGLGFGMIARHGRTLEVHGVPGSRTSARRSVKALGPGVAADPGWL